MISNYRVGVRFRASCFLLVDRALFSFPFSPFLAPFYRERESESERRRELIYRGLERELSAFTVITRERERSEIETGEHEKSEIETREQERSEIETIEQWRSEIATFLDLTSCFLFLSLQMKFLHHTSEISSCKTSSFVLILQLVTHLFISRTSLWFSSLFFISHRSLCLGKSMCASSLLKSLSPFKPHNLNQTLLSFLNPLNCSVF